jgi:hypothetical protein
MAYQVSVFLENKIGHLKKVTHVLNEAKINIRAMTLSHSAMGWGILNLVVSNPEKAIEWLIKSGLSATLREIVVVEMEDTPGGLDRLLEKITEAGVNFTNAYGRIVDAGKMAYLVIDVEDMQNATEKLVGAGLVLAPESKVYGNGASH